MDFLEKHRSAFNCEKNHPIRARDELCDEHTLQYTFTSLNILKSEIINSPLLMPGSWFTLLSAQCLWMLKQWNQM